MLTVLMTMFFFFQHDIPRDIEKAKVKMQGFILSSLGASLGSGRFIYLILKTSPSPDQDSSCFQSVPIYITCL